MKTASTGKHRKSFSVVLSTRSAQMAKMVLAPGESTGEPSNEHPKSEQWLFVVSGSGTVLAGKRRISIRKNSLVLIEKGEIHQVTNTGRKPLISINFYAPPAYTSDGDPRSSMTSKRRSD